MLFKKKNFFDQFCQKNKKIVQRVAEKKKFRSESRRKKKISFAEIRTMPPQMINGRPLTSIVSPLYQQ